jgi:hypothetical protein
MRHFWRYLAPLAGALHYLIPLVIGGGLVAVRKFMQRIRENRAAMWPSADGFVQAVEVKRHQHGYWAEISYRYYAQQQYHYGKYHRYFVRKAAADSFTQAMRSRSLQVRFREDKPDESVILEQDLRMTGVLQTG